MKNNSIKLCNVSFFSVTVPLSQDKFWSSRMAEFTGRSHRALFDESLQELYTDLYNKARDL